MQIYSYPLFSAGDLSQSSLTSQSVEVYNMLGFSIQCTFTGDAVGTLTINASDDLVSEGQKAQIVNWTTITTQDLTAPGNIMFNISSPMYRWIQLVYTNTSGTGSLIANFHAKGV